VKTSRLVTTTILGAVFGVICMFATRYSAEIAFWPLGVAFLLHHTVLGFTIGASSLKMHWAIHGVLWGALFGVFLGIIGTDIYPDPWQLFVMPVIWGFLIETLATKVFKQPR
jgi:hypothetical protein